ncbi:predicted protein [Phaeodactylum tricornutum CCAP 1055/1]|uniref:Uncharacterized protein n=1 Tax=Phaeodactylum tricornutum (strain CCAP 1055/1) TaxID=556484 RepID=B7G5X6_PHATC|nr:predicted protein [Phaeodactylum tricornutum CCAP 1055/1]EEC45767.1 predicted protein [Phaeodactylum tricornutum CCAP 1055/1]|eukprot:XP_002182480.1 predicted protein [Phaeodactylum tricornutum CCAP 1055/1]
MRTRRQSLRDELHQESLDNDRASSTASLPMSASRRSRPPPPPPPPSSRMVADAAPTNPTGANPPGAASCGRDNNNNNDPADAPPIQIPPVETQQAPRTQSTLPQSQKAGLQQPIVATTPATIPARTWILKLRVPSLHQQQQQQQPKHSPPAPRGQNAHPTPSSLPPVLQIHVSPTMTSATLASCIQQATTHHSYFLGDPPVGLFDVASGVFVSLDYLLAATATSTAVPNRESMEDKERDLIQNSTYTLYWAPPPPPPIHIPCVSTAVYRWTIELPLQELYRHGPWMVGWEGESLPRICARITYHGDAAFWSRNLEECERIYDAKEEAFLRIARPSVYIVLVVLVMLFARWLVAEALHVWADRDRRRAAAYRQRHHGMDADMMETYRAWQTLMRQVQRAVTPPHKSESVPPAQQAEQSSGRTR